MEITHDGTAMGRYLDSISRHPLLTAAEEIELARQIQCAKRIQEQEGKPTRREKRLIALGERAKNRMVNANLRLVVHVAKQYQRRKKLNHMELLDLVQEGAMGLMRATELFDPERGYKFSTYCYWWIRQGILRAIYYQDQAIRRPIQVAELGMKLPKIITDLSVKHNRPPSVEEIAEAAKANVKEVRLLMERGSAIFSLDSINPYSDELTLLDTLADPQAMVADDIYLEVEQELVSPTVAKALTHLTEKELKFVQDYYGLHGKEPQSMSQIGRSHKLSRERVRQIIEIALNKIRIEVRYHREKGLFASRTGEALAEAIEAGGELLDSPERPRHTVLTPIPQCAPPLCA